MRLSSELFSVFGLSLLAAGCASDDGRGHIFAAGKFSVISDPHYFDSSTLLESGADAGTAFLTDYFSDRKLILESSAILDAAITSLLAEESSFVLVTGDMTYNGEKANHEAFIAKMRALENAGKKIYVVPGNHDINNPKAAKYMNGGTKSAVPTVTATEFVQLYADFGYTEALYRDSNSLSYVAEPVDGIWLIGLDTNRYSENTSSAVTGGKLSQATVDWVVARLEEAKSLGKYPVAFAHHPFVEHFTGMKTLWPDHVIADNENLLDIFARGGGDLELMFTGHFHSNDLSLSRKIDAGAGTDRDLEFLIDVETGSLVSFPCAYRNVVLNANTTMEIRTKPITAVTYNTGGAPFQDYAKAALQAQLLEIGKAVLGAAPYSLTDPTLTQLATLTAQAYVAHSAGDETPTAETLATIQSLQASVQTKLFGDLLLAIWVDLIPTYDKNVRVDMFSISSTPL